MADSDRVAELKRKMQEKALAAKAEAAATEAQAAPAPAAAATSAPSTQPVAVAEAIADDVPAAASDGDEVVNDAGSAEVLHVAPAPSTPSPVAVAAATIAAPPPAPNSGPAIAATNGSSNGVAHAAGALDDTSYVPQVLSPEELAKRDMNRREFLTYSFAGALLLVSGATGFGLFQFLYPRFKAGEFGGAFYLGPVSAMPSTDAPPEGYTAGKFWLVNTTDEGVKALYMVCTHLGCLYKWESSTVRFECPCHGSKFSREGFYIEGPAPRSLDRFETSEVNGELVVDTGAKITGAPASESPARAAA